jgi:hypothetical protein
MKFWDASAVVPLLVAERPSADLLELLARDQAILAWWGTPVECASAIARREREGALSGAASSAALGRLRALAGSWHEVLPSEAVRELAQRLLRVHPLRAADSLQLAAALVAADGDPATLDFVCLDERLNDAARREGLRLAAG